MKNKQLQRYTIELLAECFATCMLILIGDGTIANYKFAQQLTHATLPIAISFGIGVYSGSICLEINKRIRIDFVNDVIFLLLFYFFLKDS